MDNCRYCRHVKVTETDELWCEIWGGPIDEPTKGSCDDFHAELC